jgi:hypothetical protein
MLCIKARRAVEAIKDLVLAPALFLCSELSSHKHFVQDAPWQGLKPNSLSVLYGPTKVVP